jgi:hypothetical protein
MGSSLAANYVLTGRPFQVTPDWSEQTVTLSANPRDWTCLGARHDLLGYYGCDDIDAVLQDVNVDLILVLFPVQVTPLDPGVEIHSGRPHFEYEVDWSTLPSGTVEVDTIRIDYPEVTQT